MLKVCFIFAVNHHNSFRAWLRLYREHRNFIVERMMKNAGRLMFKIWQKLEADRGGQKLVLLEHRKFQVERMLCDFYRLMSKVWQKSEADRAWRKMVLSQSVQQQRIKDAVAEFID